MTSISCPVCGGGLDPVIEKDIEGCRTWLECRECAATYQWDDARLMDEEESAA